MEPEKVGNEKSQITKYKYQINLNPLTTKYETLVVIHIHNYKPETINHKP